MLKNIVKKVYVYILFFKFLFFGERILLEYGLIFYKYKCMRWVIYYIYDIVNLYLI